MSAQDLPLPLGHFVTLADGLRLHYLDEGQGPVVLWLHGSGPGASGYSNFKGNYPEFAAAGYRNIVLDLPGFGRSDKPEDTEYCLEFFVAALSGFLDAVGIERCTLLGNSLGGAIALGQALARPESVAALVLMAPGGVEERETYFQMEGIQRMVEVYSAGPMGVEEMRQVMSLQLFDASQLDDALLAERAAVAATQPRSLFAGMRVANMTARLGELRCPILGFWGSNDRFNPIGGALKFLDHAPQARFLLLNRCGHWVQVEHRELFNRTCLDFLGEQ
ncbi:4,5:9,10-diseco-3-hydroxy-5,9,17-trioxoandrosta-1(10),2-diene-4-oate hydrolase [Geopseudomonas sagittaria]|uniref:4,5:9,10-diseco-3-hydroxy-5,9,17-trioxoandrosta-1(10),2-diene-4-oate hydrolase n=1 Tax=Geopseudomonas sagittaria TaxID=1135990 RepID=A0A1I5R0B2_9GAMM|nr:alpha/beta fold hydrolase [Pseudomonas sagittaria]SFP51935.1 4,5:9,10-diseco-3-hydroxy-5,9,17-trioxoandrosta-1(10),2-diene-4-oate hydrolase [Pseudomonas sagittaria]